MPLERFDPHDLFKSDALPTEPSASTKSFKKRRKKSFQTSTLRERHTEREREREIERERVREKGE